MKPSHWKEQLRMSLRYVILSAAGVVLLLLLVRNRRESPICDTTETLPTDRSMGDLWTVCTPRSFAQRPPLVYTVGVGRNVNWDAAMIERFNSIHHGWDPTPRSVSWFTGSPEKFPRNFFFHPYGLAPTDGNLQVELPSGNTDSFVQSTIADSMPANRGSRNKTTIPVLSLKSMMWMLGHSDRRLDILKIDIEGAELDLVQAWVAQRWQPPADQILLEEHARYFPGAKGENFLRDLREAFDRLGFAQFHKRDREYVFVRKERLRWAQMMAPAS